MLDFASIDWRNYWRSHLQTGQIMGQLIGPNYVRI
jgi:hypothetical protein